MGIDRPIEELQAGDAFRNILIKKADGTLHGGPAWCGWALMDAFLAGIDYARGRIPTTSEIENKREAMWDSMKKVAAMCLQQPVPGKTRDDQIDLLIDSLDVVRALQKAQNDLMEYVSAGIIPNEEEFDRQFHRRKHKAERANEEINRSAALFHGEIDAELT